MILSIDIQKRRNGSQEVSLIGKLAEQSYLQLEEALVPILKVPPKHLCFNLSGLDFISSMGIRVILKTRKVVEIAGGHMVMTNLQPQIKKVFDIVAVSPKTRYFPVSKRPIAILQRCRNRKRPGKTTNSRLKHVYHQRELLRRRPKCSQKTGVGLYTDCSGGGNSPRS